MAFGSEVLFIVICLNQEDFRMKHNPYSSSQRRTPWDGKKDLSPVQAFIRSEYLDTWHRHHPLLKETDEADFLNLLEVRCCRYCGSVDFKKNGYTSNGVQRYRCTDCSERSPYCRTRCLILTRCPSSNGSNTCLTCLAMYPSIPHQETPGSPIRPSNTGSSSCLRY